MNDSFVVEPHKYKKNINIVKMKPWPSSPPATQNVSPQLNVSVDCIYFWATSKPLAVNSAAQVQGN